MNIRDGMCWGEKELSKKGIENPRFDADLLLGEVLKKARDRLYLDWEHDLSFQEEESFRSLIQRRAANVPLQYILKRQEFMGLPFYVDERVLIPRADSEILVEKLLESMELEKEQRAGQKIKVADLCTGSGALAISTAYYFPSAEVVGTDLSFAALEVAEMNAKELEVSVQWRQGDFLKAIANERWDYIITNPPYVSLKDYDDCAPEIFYEPKMAFLGGEDGLNFYRCLVEGVGSILNPQGKVFMEIGWDQGEAVCSLFQKKGFATQVFQDLAGRDRVILAR
ncbi:protein-(glutamine-N5) methyltransferase, release factor-specific [Desulfosporosinus orientis DSM 765]|uniref:Release factor glutamine methyltransferase n=1 Tax=Desulfosporosinus orientis (strain ATCC 19365 / DSM 765 / NCIMB 8382 / VKM B-1628 / Singapore I) TaxID=768706 RepID=G7WHJ0_DESOD|nr:peptide chain release factor N(5)-glutamine methyltransferase [Desulfosporosinus orientis]AET70911.1 protein-(glutamine-N5) methyltransferase, release factor-specific [Desulfosporosinus orientis DSM 765]